MERFSAKNDTRLEFISGDAIVVFRGLVKCHACGCWINGKTQKYCNIGSIHNEDYEGEVLKMKWGRICQSCYEIYGEFLQKFLKCVRKKGAGEQGECEHE